MSSDELAKVILNIIVFIVPILLTVFTYIKMNKHRSAEDKKLSADNFMYIIFIPLASMLFFSMASIVFIGWFGGAILNMLGFNIY